MGYEPQTSKHEATLTTADQDQEILFWLTKMYSSLMAKIKLSIFVLFTRDSRGQ